MTSFLLSQQKRRSRFHIRWTHRIFGNSWHHDSGSYPIFSQQMVARRYVKTIAMLQSLKVAIATGMILDLKAFLNTNNPGCINFLQAFYYSQLASDARIRFSESIPLTRSDAIPDDIRQGAHPCKASCQSSHTGRRQQNQFYFYVLPWPRQFSPT